MNRRLWVRPRLSNFFQNTVSSWSDNEFKGNLRVSRQTFTYLVAELNPTLRRQNTIRSSVPVDQRIAIALWRLGTNIEYRTLSHLFGVGLSTVCVIVHEVCRAIVEVLSERYIKLPKDDTNAQAIVDGFLHCWQFPQCTGAIDGSHIPIIAPPVSPKDYVNRKGFHSILLQAVVDHQCRFLDIYIGWPGSTHDARVFYNSNVYINGAAGQLVPNKAQQIHGQQVPLLILGDPAYPLLPWLMKPYSQTGLTRKQRKFNYQLSRARIVTEIAFGRLKGRWRCLLKRNDTAMHYLTKQVAACCVLHNLCEIHMDTFDESWEVDISSTTAASFTHSSQSAPIPSQAQAVREALASHFDI